MPRWIERLILSAGTDASRALEIASRKRGFVPGSPPPALAATMISLLSFVKTFPRTASCLPLRIRIFFHFEWPAITLFWHARYFKVSRYSPIALRLPCPIFENAGMVDPGDMLFGFDRWSICHCRSGCRDAVPTKSGPPFPEP